MTGGGGIAAMLLLKRKTQERMTNIWDNLNVLLLLYIRQMGFTRVTLSRVMLPHYQTPVVMFTLLISDRIGRQV